MHQPWQDFAGQQEAGLATILDNVTHGSWASTILAAGAVISIFTVTLVTLYGMTRILFAMGRDGLLPKWFAAVNPRTMTPVNNTVIVAVAASILAAVVPLNKLADMVSIGTLTAFIVVSIGVIILRVRRARPTARVPGAGLPCDAYSFGVGVRLPAHSLHWYTWIAFSGWVGVALVFYLLWGRHHSALNEEEHAAQTEEL